MGEGLEVVCEDVARWIGEAYEEYGGYRVRADAGEAGLVYVALRGAKKDVAVGERFAEELARLLEERLGERAQFAVSLGAGNRDLLLQIELRATPRAG